MSAISAAGLERARLHMDVGRARARRAADAAAGMAGRLQPQLPRRGAVEQPAGRAGRRRPAGAAAVATPSPSNGLERRPARPVRIVDDDDRRRRTAPRPRGRAGSWSCGRWRGRSSRRAGAPIRLPPTRGSNSDRHRPAGELAGIEPLHRALAGQPADRLGRVEIGIMADAVAGMVALHVAARRRRSRSPSRHSRWSYSRARSRGWSRARPPSGRR